MLGLLIPIGLAYAGWRLWRYEHDKAQAKVGHLGLLAPPGHPIAGVPPQAVIGLTPPGVSQPPGVVVSLPPVRVVPPALHDAAAELLSQLLAGAPAPGVTSGFQSHFNALARPAVKLAVDDRYGPKTQAALQSVVTPAVAPPGSVGPTGLPLVPVALPAQPAPQPNPAIVDVFQAAADLAQALAGGGRKGSIPQVATFQAAWNARPSASPRLVPDARYGPNTQAALAAVLAASDSGDVAPQNAYGPPRAGAAPVTFA